MLNFFFDFHCPYCYVAWNILSKSRQIIGDKISFKGVGLYPSANPRLHGRQIWSEQRWKLIFEMAAREGLEIRKPTREWSPLPLTGLKAYTGISLNEYVTAVFKAVFQYDVDTSSIQKMTNHLQSEGVDPTPFSDVADDRAVRKKVKDDSLLWGHCRIRLLPTLEIDEERYSGLLDSRGVQNFLSNFLTTE